MMHVAYLVALLVPIACTAAVDRRWRLVLWADRRRGVVVLAIGIAAFLLWDVVAIDHGFYRRGGSGFMTGVEVAPHLPVEELLFVGFLCYFTLVAHRLVHDLLLRRTQARTSSGAEAVRVR